MDDIVFNYRDDFAETGGLASWDSQPSVGIFGNFFNFRQQHSNMVRREPASLLIMAAVHTIHRTKGKGSV